MKVSINWVKQFINFELPPLNELVERIGTQLGAIEEVEDIGAKYHGVLMVKVVSCIPHENSDHLRVCLIDDGGKVTDIERNENGLVQVVCGAKNVREGLTVVWLPPGTTVPESFGKDPFVLGKRELRGVTSNGMLASSRELALGENHDGILEIDKEVEPGSDFAPAYKLDDYLINIENKMFTHRPDCFGVLGVAREIAGILGKPFVSPEWYQPHGDFPTKTADLPLNITNEIPELVSRISAITLADVKIGPSPIWLQVALAKMGHKSISNVVDLTNFYMLITGQPLHAYDYDKVSALTDGTGADITVRHPWPGEKITLLNGKEIEPREEAMMIASGNHLISLGGVMGGFDTEVDNHTHNIILEAANFDMYNIRRTSMVHGLFTDAVTRFNKGQSPLQTLAVLAKITLHIQQMSDAKVASELVDFNRLAGRQWIHPPIQISGDFINARLGLQLSADEMKILLENVEMAVIVESHTLHVIAPFWRTDIETREDVIEEIGRLYGFDRLPLELPRRTIKPVSKDPMLTLKSQVREYLSKAGANEVLTYSFVHGDLLQKVGQTSEHAFRVGNALSPDLQYFRLSLTPSILDKIHMNNKVGYDEFALFELGKGHNVAYATDDNGLPLEFDMLDVVYTRGDKIKEPGAAFYNARQILVYLLSQFGITPEFRVLDAEEDYPVAKPYDYLRSAKVFVMGTDLSIGLLGEYKASVRRNLKLPAHTAGFSIGLQQLMQAKSEHDKGVCYTALSKFPSVTQDITLKVSADTPFEPFFLFLREQCNLLKPLKTFATFYAIDNYQSHDDLEHKQLSFRIQITSYERTLIDAEITELLEKITVTAQDKYGADRI